MKKLFTLLTLLVTATGISHAYDFKSGNLYYNRVRTDDDRLAAEVTYAYNGMVFGYSGLS